MIETLRCVICKALFIEDFPEPSSDTIIPTDKEGYALGICEKHPYIKIPFALEKPKN